MLRKYRKTKLFLISLVVVFQSVATVAQTDTAHWNYIRKYSKAAVAEMYYSKIPASITMAQALHESRYGTSELAVKANNHFGIKCQTGWMGRTYKYQDDDNNTCFRLYDSVGQSFRDHSDFLMTRPRYAFLFSLNPGDYTAWAHGLKQAGYATNPNYAPILIKLIEDYRLYQLDSVLPEVIAMNSVADRDHQLPNKIPEAVVPVTRVFHRNRIDFVVARPGDNVSKLTRELDLLRWEIRKYNEIPKKRDIQPGQVVYLQPKRRQAEAGYALHTVVKGETMYSISQLYGVKLCWLYKRNHMKKGTQPKVGQEIWLRGMKPGKKR